MVRIEIRIPEGDWERVRAAYESEGQALRAIRLLFEDGVRVALVGGVAVNDGGEPVSF
jgi:hypothetical protein